LVRLKLYKLQRQLEDFGIPEYVLLTGFSIIVGITAGLTAVLFHDAIEWVHHLFFYDVGKIFSNNLKWGIILLPALGMFLQSLMIQVAPTLAAQKGVTEVIKAVAVRGGHIPFRTTLFHFIAPVINIGSGGTVGPEGPIAQVGAGVASKVSGVFGLTEQRKRILTAAGSGAAIAAVFNTPLGGVFFALEVILLNDFQTPIFSALILASVAASAVSHSFLGDNPTFVFKSLAIGPAWQYYFYALLGLVSGLISIMFFKYSERTYEFIKNSVLAKNPQWLTMTSVGLLVGSCGYFYPEIFGVGYEAINEVLADKLTWQTVFVLLVMKFMLVPLVLNSGGFGGIFAPALFMGACVGFLFITIFNYMFQMNLDITAFVLVGMGAMLGGINSIPLSAILIIFEMTRDYSFILPLMLGVIISTTIVHLVFKDSVYKRKLEKEGFRFANGKNIQLLQNLQVKNYMSQDIQMIPEDMPLPNIMEKMLSCPSSTFYTIDKKGQLKGMITDQELRTILAEYDALRSIAVAQDIARTDILTVNETDSLQDVIQLFTKYPQFEELPVVSPNNPNQIIGAICRQDVIRAYNQELLKQNFSDSIATELRMLNKVKSINVAGDYSIIEKVAPERFVGKTLKQLRLRNKYNVEVLMIKRPAKFGESEAEAKIIMPDADYKIHEGDKLILFGRQQDIANIEKWR
jgi:CIC family chloride channel protein